MITKNSSFNYGIKKEKNLEERINNNSVKFSYQGNDLELKFLNNSSEEKCIILKIFNNNTTLYYNQKMFFNKPTPHLLLHNKYQHYEIVIENDILKLIVENKFTLLNVQLPEKDLSFNEVDVKTDGEGSWII